MTTRTKYLVAAGVLFALALWAASQTFHSECVEGYGGRDPVCVSEVQRPGAPVLLVAVFGGLGALCLWNAAKEA